jgi:hypothetical protein
MAGIEIIFENELGVQYDLTKPGALYYAKVQLSETKKLRAIVRNKDAYRVLESVVITPVVHPTEPMGSAQDTYDACTLSTTESGTYTPTLTLGNITAGGTATIWIAWAVAADANPGWCFWALKTEGEYTV